VFIVCAQYLKHDREEDCSFAVLVKRLEVVMAPSTRKQTKLLLGLALLVSSLTSVRAQTPSSDTEVWPKVSVTYDFGTRTRIQGYFEKHNGEDVSLEQWKVGTMFSYRMKRMLTERHQEIDDENKYNLVVGGGYEFIQTDRNGSTKSEHRIMLQGSPKYLVPFKFLAQDRNRVEFRWVDSAYNFRYRNKLTVDRPLSVDKFRFTPYASGELFWDRNHSSWNENQYAFGVEFPYRKLFMLDVYYLHQNCTTCSEKSTNVFGITANFYLGQKKK
jgi:hypothetical protein